MEELMFLPETFHWKDTRLLRLGELGFHTLLRNASILVHIVVFWRIQMFLEA